MTNKMQFYSSLGLTGALAITLISHMIVGYPAIRGALLMLWFIIFFSLVGLTLMSAIDTRKTLGRWATKNDYIAGSMPVWGFVGVLILATAIGLFIGG